MLKKGAILFIVSCFWIFAGCAAMIVGASAGAGTYTYVKGELKRDYNADYAATMKVCLDILHDLNQPILERTTDGEETTIKTERKDATPQTIIVAISNPEWTEVSVRTGVVGFWKEEVSQQFHEFIAERLKK
jgi:hypothetical protein